MDDRASIGSPTDDVAEIEAVLSHLLQQLNEVCVQMQRDQTEIDQIKAETRALKANGEAVEAETWALLAELKNCG